MIVEKAYPSGVEELLAFVKKHCAGVKSVAVQAGHFLLYYDHTENLVLPGVAEELVSPRFSIIRNQIGYFPLATWKLGLRLLTEIEADKKQVFCVVNDWQYLPENAAGVDRNVFYQKTPSLFSSYAEELLRHTGVELLTPPVTPNSSKTVFFSEQTLRNQYERHIKKVRHQFQGQQLPQERYDLIQCIQDKEEIWCYKKRPNCVHEVAELLFQLQNLSAPDVYIGIYPKSCMGYITQGTELAQELFNIRMRVCNIGLPAVAITDQNFFIGAIAEYFCQK